MDTWERESPSIYDGPTLIPNSGVELCARSSIQNSVLPEAEAPPLVSKNFESANENSEPAEKNVNRLKLSVSSTTPDAEVSTPPATSSKTVSSVGSRTVVIFGMLGFAAGLGLGAILFSKSSWNLHALRPAYESIAARLHLVSAQTTPLAASTSDGSLSETANQLQSIGTELTSLRQDVRELTSLRQDIRSLAGELAQLREAQEGLIAGLIAAQAQLVRKSERPGSRTSDPRDNRGTRPPP